MDAKHLLLFATAYLAILMLPGPGVTGLVARVLSRGLGGIPLFIAGLITGPLTWFTLAASGMAVLAATLAPVFTALRYAGAAYLLFLAWKLWRSAPAALKGSQPRLDGPLRTFATGLAISLGNPKSIAFFLALLPAVIDLRGLTIAGYGLLALTITGTAVTVMTAYALLAARARRLFASPRAGRAINRGSALVMGGTAALLVRN